MQPLSCLKYGIHVFLFVAGEPHHALPEEVLGTILVMSTVNLAKILRPLVDIKEVQHLSSRYNGIEITENEENRKMTVELFKHAKVVDGEKVKTNLLCRSLLHHIQQWTQDKGRKTDFSVRYPLHHFSQRTERRIKDQSTYFISIHICEHDRTQAAHTPPPQYHSPYFHVLSNLLQHVSDVKDFVNSVCQVLWIAVTTTRQVEGCQVNSEMRNQIGQRQCFEFATSVAMQVEHCLLGLAIWTVEDVALQFFSVTIGDCKVDTLDGVSIDKALPWPIGTEFGLYLSRADDVTPSLFKYLHLSVFIM